MEYVTCCGKIYTDKICVRKLPEPKFGGAFYQSDKLVYITKVIYNEPATIVFWSDGSKTISKCNTGDIYNKEMGLTIAVLKKLQGNDFVKKLYSDWFVDTDKNKGVTISLSDVRKSHKENK